jgi:ribulose 1,5-bisphosphate synthetase/thiazole synthase
MDRLSTIQQPAREIPVTGAYDVIVCGGGPSGIAAAISAGRLGAKTLLLERYGFLGGMATAGMVTAFSRFNSGDEPVIEGIPIEILNRMEEMGGLRRGTTFFDHNWFFLNPEVLKYLSLIMMQEAGVEILLHSLVCDVWKTEDCLQGVIVENKSGRQALQAGVVVDATGDADVCALAGAAFEKGRPQDGLLNPMSMMFWMGNVDKSRLEQYEAEIDPCGTYRTVHMMRTWAQARICGEELPPVEGLYSCSATPIPGVYQILATRIMNWNDATNARDLTQAQIEGIKQVQQVVRFLKKHIPAFENSYLLQTAPQIGIRETRRIVGEYVLTADDILGARKFPDVIARGCYKIDLHNPKGTGAVARKLVEGESYDIPYRCLLPQKIDGLLVCGRPISTTHEAHGSTRVMSHCMATGHASGAAAALAALSGITPRSMEVREIQQKLILQGANLGDN